MKYTNKVFGCILLGLIFAGGQAYAELYNRAPDVLPGTLPEMRTSDYWVQKMSKPDEVILTLDAIRKMNDVYRKFIASPDPFKDVPADRRPILTDLAYWWPGHVSMAPDLRVLPPKAVADTVRTRIKAEIKFMRGKEFGNYLAVRYSSGQLDKFEKEMALDRVNDEMKVREGIAVRYTRLRNVPSFFPEQQGITENAKTRWDQWNVAILKIARPVMVLHPSLSGEYLFVLCGEGYGWVRSEDIAFGDKKEIDAYVNSPNFLVCTGDRIQYYSDESCTYSSGWMGMGDRIPLVSKGNSRTVKVPVRKANGKFTNETAWLPRNTDVSVGWLPYTRRNVVVTALKLLDNPYDWSGAFFGRQHETTYRDIFSVFGFELPWHGGLFTFFGHNQEVMHPNIGKESQYKMILQHEPFITVQSCGGHAQLLLGDYNGVPIVFDQHGYGYTDENKKDLEIRRCCIGDQRWPTYFLTRNVTFLELK
ncbi:MAG: SH3 domain-containing protein [Candidatus Latescibacter sp.]|nr:SH3 domain-containing protein [Candidatus Latescibacter sp.]